MNFNIVDEYYLCYENSDVSWNRRTVDLSRFAGETVDLEFGLMTDFSIVSNLFLDDIGFTTTLELPQRHIRPISPSPLIMKPANSQ